MIWLVAVMEDLAADLVTEEGHRVVDLEVGTDLHDETLATEADHLVVDRLAVDLEEATDLHDATLAIEVAHLGVALATVEDREEAARVDTKTAMRAAMVVEAREMTEVDYDAGRRWLVKFPLAVSPFAHSYSCRSYSLESAFVI